MEGGTKHHPASVLVVDDDEIFCRRLAKALTQRGHDVRSAYGYEAALESAKNRIPSHAIVDMRMSGGSGLELTQKLHKASAAMRIVVLTGYGSITTAVEAVRLGAADYLTKPASLETITNALFGSSQQGGKIAIGDDAVPSLSRVEWEHIQRVLKDCDGNVSEAARRLGIHRRSLQRKLNNAPLEPAVQPGSGAFDFLAGSGYSVWLNENLSMDASAQYVFRTKEEGFKIGDQLSCGAALAYRFTESTNTYPQVSVFGEVLLRHLLENEEDGEKVNNSGGTVLFLSPGARIGFSEHTSASFSVQVPVIQDLNDVQQETDAKVSFALSFSF